jgi:hypothetical protein
MERDDEIEKNSGDKTIGLTARILSRLCDKLLGDCTDKFTKIELVLRSNQ